MNLAWGYHFTVAPRFHLAEDWASRLLIGSAEENDSWRAPTAEELLSLLLAATQGEVCLFNLPDHLRSRCWHLLEQGAAALGDGRLPGFDDFATRLRDFFAFKTMPFPENACCELVVCQPGQPFVPAGSRLWGALNLDETATSLVLDQPGVPPVRLVLGPGEGVRLPWGERAIKGCSGKPEPDVLLAIVFPNC